MMVSCLAISMGSKSSWVNVRGVIRGKMGLGGRLSNVNCLCAGTPPSKGEQKIKNKLNNQKKSKEIKRQKDK